MATDTRRRTTACVSEAFDFLNNPEFNDEIVVKNNTLIKKSVSDTGLVNLPREGFHSNRLLKTNGIVGTFVKSRENISEHDQEKVLEGDDFTIVTYVDDGSNSKHGIGNNNQSDSGFIQESGFDFEGELGENNDEFTIIAYVESDKKKEEPDVSSTKQNDVNIPVIKSGCVSGEVINSRRDHVSSTLITSLENDKTFTSGPAGNGAVVLRKQSSFDKVSESRASLDISDRHSNNRKTSSNSADDLTQFGKDDNVLIRRQSTQTEEKQSRRTQQIVSDAFSFLKDEYGLEDDDRISAIRVSNKHSIIMPPNLDIRDIDSHPIITVGKQNRIDSNTIPVSKESIDKRGTENNNQRGTSSESSECFNGGSTNKRVLRRQKNQTSIDGENSDDSSDDDTGIYNESFRNSVWVCVSDNQVSMSSVSTIQEENETDGTSDEKYLERQGTDEVFDDGKESPRSLKMHKRSGSTTSTQSESDFKREYRLRRKCVVQRHDSQQEYHRMSAKYYDQERVVLLEKGPDDSDFGIHILDSHPAIITGVDPGSPAERAGIRDKHILISVNGVNVLESDHSEIVTLVQQKPTFVKLEIASSDVYHIRDQQMSMMSGYIFKLSNAAFVKNWKKRYMVLRHDNCLYFYKNEQEQDPLGALPLLNYLVSRHVESNKENCFKAEKYGAKTYYFMTETREDMARWVGAMNEAALRAKKKKDAWMDITSHNVGLPALEIRKPDCSGYLSKCGRTMKTWKRRYCVLKDACIYYFKNMNSQSAQGMAHLHGYTIEEPAVGGKRNSFILRPPEPQMKSFSFSADNETDKKRWISALERSIKRWIKVD